MKTTICPHCKRKWPEVEETVGGRLWRLRRDRKYSQKAISLIIGVGKSTYCMMEKGDRNLTAKNAIKVADFYDISLDYILRGKRHK